MRFLYSTVVVLSLAVSAPSMMIDFDSIGDDQAVTTQFLALAMSFGTDPSDIYANEVRRNTGLQQSGTNVLVDNSEHRDGVISFSFSPAVSQVSVTGISVEDGSTANDFDADDNLEYTVAAEPGTLALLILGSIPLLGRRRR